MARGISTRCVASCGSSRWISRFVRSSMCIGAKPAWSCCWRRTAQAPLRRENSEFRIQNSEVATLDCPTEFRILIRNSGVLMRYLWPSLFLAALLALAFGPSLLRHETAYDEELVVVSPH